MKLRNSITIELVLFIVVLVGGYYFWSTLSGLGKIGSSTGTWFSTAANNGSQFSFAGYWYLFVSRPVFQFILLRWYFRLFIWIRFLWQISRLKLNLIPTHADRAAGLGFVGQSVYALWPLMLAYGAILAGLIADRSFFQGQN